jgi:hypothetical protein
LLAQFDRGGSRLRRKEPGDILCEGEAFRRIVSDPDPREQVRQSHDTEPNFARAARSGFDLGKRIGIGLDDVVEKNNAVVNRFRQSLPVNACAGGKSSQIDRSQGAGLVGKQGLFPAWVRRLDNAQAWRGISLVDLVEKLQPRVARCPSRFHNPIEELHRFNGAGDSTGPGVAQGEIRAAIKGAKKGFGYSDGEIEIFQSTRISFGVDEFFNIRMIDPQNRHVRAAPPSTLPDDRGGVIEEIHKR